MAPDDAEGAVALPAVADGACPTAAWAVPGEVVVSAPVAAMMAAMIKAAPRCRFTDPAAVIVAVTGTVAGDDLPTTPEDVAATVTVIAEVPL